MEALFSAKLKLMDKRFISCSYGVAGTDGFGV